ncbi:unnamed protein product [Prorocentrum cordatum]|uniref:Uncharacterized protein n=1 Tax=Prorocentrum cordatum TaxID=2364126 RepID=A0ABN9XLH4_9DINO|nr:unnamed protein product [Polarella glacialis]
MSIYVHGFSAKALLSIYMRSVPNSLTPNFAILQCGYIGAADPASFGPFRHRATVVDQDPFCFPLSALPVYTTSSEPWDSALCMPGAVADAVPSATEEYRCSGCGRAGADGASWRLLDSASRSASRRAPG